MNTIIKWLRRMWRRLECFGWPHITIEVSEAISLEELSEIVAEEPSLKHFEGDITVKAYITDNRTTIKIWRCKF